MIVVIIDIILCSFFVFGMWKVICKISIISRVLDKVKYNLIDFVVFLYFFNWIDMLVIL